MLYNMKKELTVIIGKQASGKTHISQQLMQEAEVFATLDYSIFNKSEVIIDEQDAESVISFF